MASLADIMREQENESVAQKLQDEENAFIKEQESIWARFKPKQAQTQTDIDKDAQLARQLAGLDVKDDAPPTDQEVLALEQLRADEEFALALQNQERAQFVVSQTSEKVLSLQEQRALYGGEEMEDFAPEAQEVLMEQYDYSSFRSDEEEELQSQMREDQEIAFVYKRTTVFGNSSRISMHHKAYQGKKKKSKRPHKGPIGGNQRVFRRKSKGFDYGLVTGIPGGANIQVFLFSDCRTVLCRVPGRMKYGYNTESHWFRRGSVVLIRLKNNETVFIPELALVYTNEEYDLLRSEDAFKTKDFVRTMPTEIVHKILNMLDEEDLVEVLPSVAPHWSIVVKEIRHLELDVKQANNVTTEQTHEDIDIEML